MATQGALIRAIDYTEIQKDVARLLGDRILDNKYTSDPQRATYGYGQTISSGAVARESLADDAHIGSLKADVRRIAIHCGVEFNPAIVNLPTVQQGDLIENEHLSAFEVAVNLLNANRFNLAAGQYSDEVSNISNSRSTSWGVSGSYLYGLGGNTIKHSFTLDFGTSTNARYFFNSGSQVRLTASRTGGSASQNNTVWSNLLSSMGTIVFGHASTYSTGSGTGSNIGFYQLTNSPQKLYTRTGVLGTGAYTSKYVANDYTVYARCDVANNSLGQSSRVLFDVEFNDDHTSQVYLNDITDGLISSNVTIRRASGIHVNVAGPTATNTRLLSNN